MITLIHILNIFNKDLNLLLLFKVLYEELNLSVAAQRVALSQPALSHKLNKMRKEYDDPLFVKAARGLTATPKAHELATSIANLTGDIERFYQSLETSDFSQNNDVIKIFSTDYIEQRLLPKLLPRLRKSAPNVRVVTCNTRGIFPKRELEIGDCDLAIAGFFSDLPDTYYQQKLFNESFVCIVDKSHPIDSQSWNIERYIEYPHVLTTLTGDLEGLIDVSLKKLNLQRQVVAGLSSFLAPSSLIDGTDFILTCLDGIADIALDQYPNLEKRVCPVPLNEIELMQTWHQRTHTDPLRRWIRGLIKDILTTH